MPTDKKLFDGLLKSYKDESEKILQEDIKKGKPTHNLESDLWLTPEIVDKICASDKYAQNMYAAMCNVTWQEHDVWEVLLDKEWGCSWRYAGGMIAGIRKQGDYMDWYCSGIGDVLGNGDDTGSKGYVGEGIVTDEIREDLASIGWIPINEDKDDSNIL